MVFHVMLNETEEHYPDGRNDSEVDDPESGRNELEVEELSW